MVPVSTLMTFLSYFRSNVILASHHAMADIVFYFSKPTFISWNNYHLNEFFELTLLYQCKHNIPLWHKLTRNNITLWLKTMLVSNALASYSERGNTFIGDHDISSIQWTNQYKTRAGVHWILYPWNSKPLKESTNNAVTPMSLTYRLTDRLLILGNSKLGEG